MVVVEWTEKGLEKFLDVEKAKVTQHMCCLPSFINAPRCFQAVEEHASVIKCREKEEKVELTLDNCIEQFCVNETLGVNDQW